MTFGIDRVARPKKKRKTDGKQVAERVGWLARRVLRGAVKNAGWKDDKFTVSLSLHAAAPMAKLVVRPDGEIGFRARTAEIGPGYHADALARLMPILDELEYAWIDDGIDDVQDEMTRWLAEELAAGPVRLGVPADRTFRIDAPVLTPLGPRDAAWRDAVIADPMRGADAFPWWQTGPGHAERARALIAMWLEIPWRDPVDDEERAMMERVHDDLLAARRANPDIDLPWADWAKLLEMLGEQELATKRRVRAGDARPSIGYRRYDMDIELSGGWSVCLPGAFVTAWDEDRERFWGSDGERTVEFTSFSAQGEGDSDRLLAVAPERHPVVERLTDERRRGRVEMYDDFDGVRIAHALMTVAPHVAILTIKGGDDAWALATWRSLQNAD
ncbi:MAG TPA: hypothetical protein VGO00_22035 [Kofleriaceae bacterium]|nr:hypothetical protein [Kofleriaceae bacterium]